MGLPMPLVALGSVMLGAGLGAVNGLLVAGLGLPSIVVTLATMVTLREALRWISRANSSTICRLVFSGLAWSG